MRRILSQLGLLVCIFAGTCHAQSVVVPAPFFGYSTTPCFQCTNPGLQGFDPGQTNISGQNGSIPLVPGLVSEGKLFPDIEWQQQQPWRGSYAATVNNFTGWTGAATGMHYWLFGTTYQTLAFSLWEYPPWTVCVNYKPKSAGNQTTGNYPGPTGASCPNPIDPDGPGGPNCPTSCTDPCNGLTTSGGGFCPGPTELQYESTLKNRADQTTHVGIPYEAMNYACNSVVYMEQQGHPPKYFEIAVEPNIEAQWSGSEVPNWYSDLIVQSYYVEQAVLHGFSATVNGVTMSCPGLNAADGANLVFLGPTPSTVPTPNAVAIIDNFFSPAGSGINNVPALGGGTVNLTGASVVTLGSYHLYLGGIEASPISPGLPAGILTCPKPTNIYATIGCTGNGLLSAVKDRIGALASYVPVGAMTEGSWSQNNYIPQYNDKDVTAQHDTAAFVMRYSLMEILGGVTMQHWFSWGGQALLGPTYGTLCDLKTPPVAPPCDSTDGGSGAGVAYGTLAAWMTGATINTTCAIAGGCLDQEGSKWAYTLTEKNGNAAEIIWVYSVVSPHAQPSYEVTGAYSQYRDYNNIVHQLSGNVTLTVVPILLEGVPGANGGNFRPVGLGDSSP